MIEIEVYARSSVANIPTIIIWVLFAVLIVSFCSLIWLKGWQEGKYYVARLMLAEWVVLVFCSAVIFRETMAASLINLIPLWSYFQYPDDSYLKEMVAINMLNVALFVPIGFLLKCGFRNITWKQVQLLSFIISSSVELMQFLFRRGLCEIDDIIHNVIGCMIGYGVAKMTLTLTLTIKKTITKKIRNEFI